MLWRHQFFEQGRLKDGLKTSNFSPEAWRPITVLNPLDMEIPDLAVLPDEKMSIVLASTAHGARRQLLCASMDQLAAGDDGVQMHVATTREHPHATWTKKKTWLTANGSGCRAKCLAKILFLTAHGDQSVLSACNLQS